MEYLLSHIPDWVALSPDSPEPVVAYHCSLVRNIRDFVFPSCCIDDERRAVEARVCDVLEGNPSLPKGAYYSVSDMDDVGMRLLAERRLITYEMLCAAGPRGVYISEGQSLGIMVNSSDHIVIRAIAPGGAMADAWDCVNQVDDLLGGILDFSYHERLGYLSKSLHMTGTGLRVGALLHLPGLAMMRQLHSVEESMKKQHVRLRGMVLGDPRAATAPVEDSLSGSAYGLSAIVEAGSCQCMYMDMLGALAVSPATTSGNLYMLTNQDTLGLSEVEILFQLDQAVSEIVTREEEARLHLMRDHGAGILDSIGRALGIAGGARQIGMGEALLLASLMRLAEAQGHMEGLDRLALNRLLLESQSAHLQIMRGIAPDDRTLAGARADLFRALFSDAAIN